MPDRIEIPLGPEVAAALLALAVLFALAVWSGLLPGLLSERMTRGWGRAGAGGRALLGAIGAFWFVLLLLAVAAGIAGALALIADPAAGGLGLGALLVALLGAPFLIWGIVIRQTTLDYQREGHITDRIAKAVEQLGTEKTVKVPAEGGGTAERSEPNIEVRLGAILALERIAQDSTRLDNGRDHVRVMEILCAYVRENAPGSTAREFPLPEWEPLKDDATEAERKTHAEWRGARFGGFSAEMFDVFAPNIRDWAQNLPGARPARRADVALALKVIGRRTLSQRRVEAAWPEPADAGTRWVFERRCPALPDDPGEVPLPPADLAAFKTELRAWQSSIRTHGYRPDLGGANLQGADLFGAILSGALLEGARLEGAVLMEARLDGSTSFRAATLRGALKDVALPEGVLSMEQIDAMFEDGSVSVPGIEPGGEGWPAHWAVRELDPPEFRDEWRKWQEDLEGYEPPG